MSIEKLHKTVIAMGAGDVLTGMAVDNAGLGYFFFLPAPEAKEPGTLEPELDGTIGADEADVMIMFASAGDVGLMIGRLAALKRSMEEHRKP